MKRKSFIAILAVVMAISLVSAASAQEKFHWRLQSSWATGLEIQRQVERFAELVTKMSGGRLTITALPAGAVVGGLEVFDAVSQGVIDAMNSLSAYWIGIEPAAPMFSAIPLGMDVMQYYAWYYYGDGLDLMQEMYAKHNIGYSAFCAINPAEDFLWAHKPITKLNDFKGLKIRTVGYWGEIATKLGARVVTLPGGELYGALEKRIIDATEFCNPESDFKSGLHEVAKYVHVPGVHQPVSFLELLINKQSWEKLPEDLQEIVKSAAKASVLEGYVTCLMADGQALREFEKNKNVIVKLPPELIAELKALAWELYDEKAAKDPFFKKVWDSQRKIIADYDHWASYMVPPQLD